MSSVRAVVLIPRSTVKLELCGTLRVKDKHIRRKMIELYGGDPEKRGRPTVPEIANLAGHMWQALAVGITYRRLIAKSEAVERIES